MDRDERPERDWSAAGAWLAGLVALGAWLALLWFMFGDVL